MKYLKILWVLLMGATLISPASADHHGKMKMDIVETAANAGTFNTLIAAAKAAGLAGALKGDGPLTVFAPTDDAFSALPAGTIETLLKPENKDQLAMILKYHVIAGKVGSGALADGARLDTLAGIDAGISKTEGSFNIENARIVATDIEASNGVVHVIDRVILPPAQMTRAESANVISMAIERGVPMFNHGNPEGTAAVYMAAAERLIRFGGLNTEQRARLEMGMKEAATASNAAASAWELRYALDDVSASMHNNGRMQMTSQMRR
ncbi:MAG: fasciclin domain-containing protein [Woeseia sp.]